MGLRIRIHPEAEAELANAALWYESKRAGLGADFVAEIDEALEQIAEAPMNFPTWREARPFRRLVVRRFPYLVFFTVSDDVIQILAFAHAKRRPGYWKDR